MNRRELLERRNELHALIVEHNNNEGLKYLRHQIIDISIERDLLSAILTQFERGIQHFDTWVSYLDNDSKFEVYSILKRHDIDKNASMPETCKTIEAILLSLSVSISELHIEIGTRSFETNNAIEQFFDLGNITDND